MGAGSRKGRISQVIRLLDADALFFDKDGDGVPELFEEALDYRYEVDRDMETVNEDVVVKEGEDRVAGMEYAIEYVAQLRIEIGEAPDGRMGRRREPVRQPEMQRF